MTISYATYPKFKAWTPQGTPASGYKFYSKLHGTNTHKKTYSDSDLTTENPEELILDDEGEADIYLENGVYDFILKTPAGADYRTFGPIEGAPNDLNNVLMVDLVTDLINYRETDSTRAFVSGYYVKGDGKAFKEFYYDSTSAATPNGATVFYGRDELATGRWLAVVGNVLTPENFGAKADGTTDDYLKINAASAYVDSLTNGGTLTFSNKTYFFGTDLSFPVGCRVYMPKGAKLKSTNKNVTFLDTFLLDSPSDCFDLGTGKVTYAIPDENEYIVDTIAQLRALPAAKYKYVSILGHTVVGDGGNGRFVYNSSSTANDDNGITIKLTATSGAGRYVRERKNDITNACWFGLQGAESNEVLPQTQEVMTANVLAFMNAFASTKYGILLIPGRNKWYGINSTLIPGAMVLKSTLTGVHTSVQVDHILPGTPQTGFLSIYIDSARDSFKSQPSGVQYTSWTGNTFTIASTDFTGVTCTRGNVVTLLGAQSSSWFLFGEDSNIHWGGKAGGRMFEVSNPYFTIVEIANLKLRGWHSADGRFQGLPGDISETTYGAAEEGLNYGRSQTGHFHYYFRRFVASWFNHSLTSTPLVLHPNDGGTNGANDFEFNNCYITFCSNGFIAGLPDQSFINCTFQNCYWVARLVSNSRVSFTRCYLGGLRAVFMLGLGAKGINVADTWFEQTGVLFDYINPGNYIYIDAGINFKNARFASLGSWAYNETQANWATTENVNTLAVALTGVTTNIVSTYVGEKETTTKWGIPNKGFLDVYTNTPGDVRRVHYDSFNHGTKTFSSLKNYFRLATELNSITDQVVVRGTIPNHTKTSGTINITRNNGIVMGLTYISYTGSTFTLSSTIDFSGSSTCRAGQLVQADVDFTAAPASAGKLLQIQSAPAFMDLRDIGGNVTIEGGDFAGPLKLPAICVQHTSTNISIDNVANNNEFPIRIIDTSGNELEGWPGLSIRQNGKHAYGLKSRLDWSSESDLITFSLAIPITSQNNGTSVEYGSLNVPGVKLSNNRPLIQVYCPSNASIYLQARVTADNTIAVSVLNATGSTLTTTLNVYGVYKACTDVRLLD